MGAADGVALGLLVGAALGCNVGANVGGPVVGARVGLEVGGRMVMGRARKCPPLVLVTTRLALLPSPKVAVGEPDWPARYTPPSGSTVRSASDSVRLPATCRPAVSRPL